MEIHIGETIKEKFTSSGLSVTELARRIRTTRQNVYGIFERSSIDTALLIRLGEALNHNFFNHFMDENVMEDIGSDYVEKRPARVVLQIEVDKDKEEEILRIAFGKEGADIISGS